jgi:hypothetical protein
MQKIQKRTNFNFRLPKNLSGLFAHVCQMKGRTRASVLIELITDWIDRESPKLQQTLAKQRDREAQHAPSGLKRVWTVGKPPLEMHGEYFKNPETDIWERIP